MFDVTLLLIFLVTCSVGTSKRFPSYVEKCHQSDPNVNVCYKKAFDNVRKHLSTGIPEFGFPLMSPLVLPQISLDDGPSFKAVFKNVKIYNLDLVQFQDINFNLPENSCALKLFFPKLRITSNYSIQGRILFLQLNGNGPADGNFTNIQAEVKLSAQRYKKGNKEYLKFSSMDIDEKIVNAVFRFEGLFKDNPELTEQTNKVVNENIHEIMDELKPAIYVAIRQTVLGLIGRIFEKFSVEELFPE